jgi:hypothetical protein
VPDDLRCSVTTPPAETVQTLRAALRARVISAWTLVFGSPAAGAKLLVRDMHSLLDEDDLADAFDAVLRSLATERTA